MKKIIFTAALALSAVFLGACGDEDSEKPAVYYDVVFVTEGGTAVEKQSVASGQCVKEPEEPEFQVKKNILAAGIRIKIFLMKLVLIFQCL